VTQILWKERKKDKKKTTQETQIAHSYCPVAGILTHRVTTALLILLANKSTISPSHTQIAGVAQDPCTLEALPGYTLTKCNATQRRDF